MFLMSTDYEPWPFFLLALLFLLTKPLDEGLLSSCWLFGVNAISGCTGILRSLAQDWIYFQQLHQLPGRSCSLPQQRLECAVVHTHTHTHTQTHTHVVSFFYSTLFEAAFTLKRFQSKTNTSYSFTNKNEYFVFVYMEAMWRLH